MQVGHEFRVSASCGPVTRGTTIRYAPCRRGDGTGGAQRHPGCRGSACPRPGGRRPTFDHDEQRPVDAGRRSPRRPGRRRWRLVASPAVVARVGETEAHVQRGGGEGASNATVGRSRTSQRPALDESARRRQPAPGARLAARSVLFWALAVNPRSKRLADQTARSAGNRVSEASIVTSTVTASATAATLQGPEPEHHQAEQRDDHRASGEEDGTAGAVQRARERRRAVGAGRAIRLGSATKTSKA